MRILRQLPVTNSDGSPKPATPLNILEKEWYNCTKCEIGCKAHRHVLWEIVPATRPSGLSGIVSSRIRVAFIGEGPGQSEDTLGRPLIGPAGRLLRKAIRRSSRAETVGYVLTNLIACRPRDAEGKNREPDMLEVENCAPRLIGLLNILKPEVIVLLGKVPQAYWASDIRRGITYLQPVTYGIYHPSYLLRDGGEKHPKYQAWEDSIFDAFDTAYGYNLAA